MEMRRVEEWFGFGFGFRFGFRVSLLGGGEWFGLGFEHRTTSPTIGVALAPIKTSIRGSYLIIIARKRINTHNCWEIDFYPVRVLGRVPYTGAKP